MDTLARLGLVVVLAAVVAIVTALYRRRTAADEAKGAVDASGADRWPPLPAELCDAGPDERLPPATWVIFTTPLCASCAAVQAELESSFPHHHVVKVDATERPDLADPYELKRAPTTLLAGPDGRILERLVGPESVLSFIGTIDPSLLH